MTIVVAGERIDEIAALRQIADVDSPQCEAPAAIASTLASESRPTA